jgi:hypothetical protein
MGAIKNFFHNEIIQVNEIPDEEYFFQKWQRQVEKEIMSWINEQETNLLWDALFGVQQIDANKFSESPNWMKNLY